MSSTSTSTAPARPAKARSGIGRPLAGLLTVLVATAAVMLGAGPAAAVSGPDGQQVTVSRSSGLDPAGQSVTVTGSGFDTSKGIYVALCVDNGAGRQPTPCLGGVDMEGAGGASAWISSNPPAYGEGVAVPYTESGGRGSFSVTLTIAAADGFTDCLDPAVAPNGCVLGTRADHTRAGDRTADVRIPVTFATGGSGDAGGSGSAAGSSDPATAGSSDAEDGSLASTGAPVALGAGLAALLVVAGIAVVVLRRSRSTDASGV